MKQWILFAIGFIFLGTVAACTPSALEPAADVLATPALTREIPTPTSPPLPTATPFVPPPLSPIEMTATAQFPTPNVSHPTSTPVPVFPGMVYQTNDGTWLVEDNWQPRLLTAGSSTLLSPDGSAWVYTEGGAWWYQTEDGVPQAISIPHDMLVNPVAWLTNEQLLVAVRPQDGALGPAWGTLSVLSLTGETVLLDETVLSAPPALSPDRQTIAYTQADQPVLYHWGDEANGRSLEPIDLNAYTPRLQGFHLDSPAWSPDGRYLAWIATGGNAHDLFQASVVLMDLPMQTSAILAVFPIIPNDTFLRPAVWSSDGRYLAYVSQAGESLSQLTVLAVPQGEVVYTAVGDTPVWSPDGRWLTFHGSEAQHLVEVSSWYTLNLYIPDNGRVLNWLP